jgi:RimJ/RimL family protein N-acetyltransferase
MEQSYWPLFNLRIRNARVEIRLATDDDLDALARLAFARCPRSSDDAIPKAMDRRTVAPARARVTPVGLESSRGVATESWTFNGAVVVDGEVVGVQDASAEHFADRRAVKTGSWLGREFQGRGIGTAMREAMLAFVFDGLGAESAISGGFVDNPASLGCRESSATKRAGAAR